MKFLIILHDQFHTSCIRNTNADTGIFHCTADPDRFSCRHRCIIIFLDHLQSLHKACGIIYDLAIRKDFSRADRIAVADLPWSDADFICHHIKQGLCRKTGLRYTKSTESSCRRIVCIVSSSLDLKVFVMVRTCCMGAGTFQDRTAKGGKSTCIRSDACFYAHDITIFITAHRHIHIERMTLRMDKERLCSGKFDFDRFLCHISKESCKMLYRHILLTAETAAYKCILHLDLISSKEQGTLMQCLVR